MSNATSIQTTIPMRIVDLTQQCKSHALVLHTLRDIDNIILLFVLLVVSGMILLVTIISSSKVRNEAPSMDTAENGKTKDNTDIMFDQDTVATLSWPFASGRDSSPKAIEDARAVTDEKLQGNEKAADSIDDADDAKRAQNAKNIKSSGLISYLLVAILLLFLDIIVLFLFSLSIQNEYWCQRPWERGSPAYYILWIGFGLRICCTSFPLIFFMEMVQKTKVLGAFRFDRVPGMAKLKSIGSVPNVLCGMVLVPFMVVFSIVFTVASLVMDGFKRFGRVMSCGGGAKKEEGDEESGSEMSDESFRHERTEELKKMQAPWIFG